MSKNIKILVLVALITISTTAFGTLLLEENFSYPAGDTLTAYGWTTTGTYVLPTVKVYSSGLSYTGYVSSGIGNAAYVDTSGQDVNKTFTSQTSGTVYTAFTVNVLKATTTGDYFFNLGRFAIGTTFIGRVYAKKDASNNLAFGLNKEIESPSYTSYSYALSTTYLFVLKYQIVSGSYNDTVRLFIFSSGVPGTEPGTPTLGPVAYNSSADPVNIGSVALRQGSASSGSRQIVDGIRIGTSWADVLQSPGGTPTQLAIISVNGGISPTINTPFSVVVQSQDADGNPADVTANTDIALTLTTGTPGSLGGTLTGQITEGENSVTFLNLTYSTVENGVVITASDETGTRNLDPDDSDPFDVLAAADHYAFVGVPAGGQVYDSIGAFTVEAHRPDNSVDPTYTGNVTIMKNTGSGNVSGTLVKACVAGVATFDNVRFDASGNYTLDATGSLTTATSGTISIMAITIPMIEDFSYTSGTSLVYNGWSAHSGSGTPIMVTTPGLIYTGYSSSGVGEATTIVGGDGSRQDIHRYFTSQTSGSVYAAFMVNVGSASTTEDYFLHFGDQPNGYVYNGRVFAKDDGLGNLEFGIDKSSGAASAITSNDFSYNTTYLIVLKYTFIDGTDNDEVKLWINPVISSSEPSENLVTPIGTDITNCGAIGLRQGSQSYSAIVDGIRVATSWVEALGIPTYTISGNVNTGTKGPIEGVTVTASGGYSGCDETDIDGNYTIEDVPHGTENITLTATKTGYTFNGPIVITPPLTGPLTGKNFIGTLLPPVVPGWYNTNIPIPTEPVTGKAVKDGGAMVVAVPQEPTDDGNVIYAFKGWRSKMFKMFDGASWTDKAEIPFAIRTTEPLRYYKKYPGKGASLCWNEGDIIYATKGNNTFEFWAYDITKEGTKEEPWAIQIPVPAAKKLKGGTSMVWYDGKVYLLAGGQKKDIAVDNFFVYDPTVEEPTWSALDKLELGVYNRTWKDGSCLAVTDDGTIYALKGGDKQNYLYAYNISARGWTLKDSMPLKYPPELIARPKTTRVKDGGAMTTDGANLYAIKGGGKQDFWMFTPGTDAVVWTPLDTIPRITVAYRRSVPKTGAALAYLDGKVYLLKGNKLDEFWYYVPGATKFERVNPSTITTTTGDVTTKLNFSLTATMFSRIVNYSVPVAGKVSLKLYNASGRLVETIHNGYMNAGIYTTTLSKVSSGVYFLKYTDGTNSADVKLIVQ